MNRQRSLFLFSILFFCSTVLQAEVKLPAIFGNGMVLQRNTDAAIWGTATKNSQITITTSWNKKEYLTKATANGDWKTKVSTPDAGGPFSISISDGNAIELKDILIGEVWVCSGQSNMEMPVKGFSSQPVLGSNKTIATSANPNIRLFDVQRKTTVVPQNDFKGEWKNCTPENVSDFSATAYFFGRMIQDVLDVPVGLICSCWGGTNITSWTSEEKLKEFDWVKLPAKDLKKPNQNTPTVLFNGMINPLVGYGMRGVIWYQGEHNRNEPENYVHYMKGIVENWRELWDIGEFPFYWCQIAPFGYHNSLNTAFIREAQYKASTITPNTGMACLMDIGEESSIHPANKETVGDRLAYWALAKTYGMSGFAFSGPVYKKMEINGSTVKLAFNHAENGLTTFGKPLVNFTIAGEDKKFYPANATLTRQGLFVSSPQVAIPVAVRYAWKDFVVGELFNTEGLPASSFRTDDWEIK